MKSSLISLSIFARDIGTRLETAMWGVPTTMRNMTTVRRLEAKLAEESSLS